jgi:hypothetical protein
VSTQRFWFEDFPEDHRYWFLAPSGTSPRLEDEREAKRRAHGLTEQDASDLENVESDIRHASVFGVQVAPLIELQQ